MTNFSVNTNAGALSALRNLNTTNNQLETVQTQVNTGLEVASTKDNAAIFSIAQNLRADISGLNSVSNSLDRAQSTTDVAVAAAEAVSDLLIQMKEKAVAAADTGLDSSSRAALDRDFVELRDQIDSIVNEASFNGTNAVVSGGQSIIAITNDTATRSISVANQNLSLGGGTVTISASQGIADAATAGTVVNNLEASISSVNTALATLGSFSQRVELQQEFVASLTDAVEVGVGNLVDANLAKASAELTALQTKQQLGLQALGIANQAPQTITSLFG
ncbi:flagellin [Yunchengibacter salinarum]|uniref:flagellin n=1 Tax=Yunchengibacter salinarum TaxID=3133399 RepID=UPI0035B67FAF